MPAAAFEALARVGYDDGHAGILVEDLLDAAGVVASLALRGDFSSGLLRIVMADGARRLAKSRTLVIVA